jgi:hypothetical protein
VVFEPQIVQLYGLRSNTDTLIHVLLNHHFIDIVRNSYIFQPLKGHLQAVQLIHPCILGQQNESPVVKFSVVCMRIVYCVCLLCTLYCVLFIVYCVCVLCTLYCVLCMCTVYFILCTVYVYCVTQQPYDVHVFRL